MGKRDIIFDIMIKDEIAAHVECIDDKVTVKQISEDIFGRYPAHRKTREGLLGFFEGRCIPRTRDPAQLRQVLKEGNIPFYDPHALVRKNHGASTDDYTWFRFQGEDLTWNDVKLRD